MSNHFNRDQMVGQRVKTVRLRNDFQLQKNECNQNALTELLMEFRHDV